ncbi:MAG: FAD-dependent oxidoreductase [Oscillospiraceae bacterium]|nr:FAD-dependent oxidoreductase [Oscillospiraceae bacterium]
MSEKTLSRRDFLRGAAALGVMATGSALGISSASAEEIPSTYIPGTYSASAMGLGGDVTVTITVDETSILDVIVQADSETEGIGKAAAVQLAEQIKQRQSFEIDSVSGASITSQAVRQAVESCVAQAKGIDVALLQAATQTADTDAAADWLGEAPVIAESDVVETIGTEVLVIGAGTSGVFAACAAVEEGAKTILIEKMDEEFGGSGIRDTLAAIGSREQLEDGDNPDKFDVITELYRQSNGYGDQRLYKVWADNSGEAVDWYADRLTEAGLRFRHEVDSHKEAVRYPIFDVGHSLQMSDTLGEHGVTANVLKDYGKKLGLEIHYGTALVSLVKEDSKVTGIYAKNEKGYVRYNASKGVIVCTGGYSLNMDMLKALQPETVKMININYSYPGSQGDGIKACLWAGAVMDETHAGMLFDRGGIAPNQVGCETPGVLFWMGSQPFLKVDLEGNRFTNESGCYDHILHTAFKLPKMTYAMVWDANYIADMQRFDSHGCSRMFPHENGAESVWPLELNESAFMPMYRDQGIVVRADTIEELAEKLGLPVENFRKTVDRYNELYDLQKDEDFGKEPYRLSEMRTAPFEGVRMSGGYFICTLDGIHINTDMNAVDRDGNAIEGLYVAGDCSGGYFDTSYPNLLAGAAAGRSVTFGRLAGKNAARR